MFSSLEKALSISSPLDWYRATRDQLSALGVASIFHTRKGGIVDLLKKRYPAIEWDPEAFQGSGYRRASQRWLAVLLAQLFPTEKVLIDYVHPELRYEETGQSLQLDAFLPESSLAFEYQGEQHFEQLPVYGAAKERIVRDEKKSALCQSKGISLIAVPYWWNKNRAALLASLIAVRPDLFDPSRGTLRSYREEAVKGAAGVASTSGLMTP